MRHPSMIYASNTCSQTTPLYYCGIYGRTELARQLISLGAEVVPKVEVDFLRQISMYILSFNLIL